MMRQTSLARRSRRSGAAFGGNHLCGKRLGSIAKTAGEDDGERQVEAVTETRESFEDFAQIAGHDFIDLNIDIAGDHGGGASASFKERHVTADVVRAQRGNDNVIGGAGKLDGGFALANDEDPVTEASLVNDLVA